MGDSQPQRIEERLAREVVLAVALLALAVVQTVVLPRPLGFAPDLLLLLVICQAVVAGPSNAARWAFYGGVSLDVCANSLLGSHALALLAAVLVGGLPLIRLSRDNWLLPLLAAVLGTLAYHTVLALTTSLMVGLVPLQTYVLVVLLPSLVLVLVPALPLFLFQRWLVSRRRGEVQVDVLRDGG